jgi:hypothetical protein
MVEGAPGRDNSGRPAYRADWSVTLRQIGQQSVTYVVVQRKPCVPFGRGGTKSVAVNDALPTGARKWHKTLPGLVATHRCCTFRVTM